MQDRDVFESLQEDAVRLGPYRVHLALALRAGPSSEGTAVVTGGTLDRLDHVEDSSFEGGFPEPVATSRATLRGHPPGPGQRCDDLRQV